MPEHLTLKQEDFPLENIPNPYKDETIIKTIVEGEKNELCITDIYGKQIFRKYLNTGYNEVIFSGANVSAGIYYYSILNNGSVIKTKRMCIIK